MFDMSALQLSKALQNKQLNVVDVVTAYLERAEKNAHNAFITVMRDKALARAQEIQAKIDAGEILSPLMGVPIALKDNISTAGTPTTCASKMHDGYVPIYNAAVVERLEQAGMIVIGKLNMDEFAMGGSSETSVFGAVRNPHDTSRVAGGSSGGSAAAVAAREVPLTLGSDTGGSIRQPCSFCGVTGIKPTYGAVSRHGAIAFASSLDQIGTLGKDINDCAAMLAIISGPDERDSTCVIDKPFAFDISLSEQLDGVKIGLPRNCFSDGLDEDTAKAIRTAIQEFTTAGATVEEFDMPLLDYAIDAYYIIACAEASSNLSRYDGLKYGHRVDADNLHDLYRNSRSEGFGLEVKRRIMLGSFVLSSGHYDAYYKRALQTRALIKDAYDKLFGQFDIILTPVAPSIAYKIGANIDDPIKMYMGDVFTCSVNMAGLPAIALPCGFSHDGLPIGLQLIGEAFSEPKLVNAAQVYQKRTDFHVRGGQT
ncbi:MAG: Asp-tRNA(Asn)/Glu-tRNA(Gln) amidotransferase subunit GatA [Oscillospiraceae bacterium]|nr:Asp-tRNA(Asn)/Glu-tRNA(Gln) amidotransferase subunit GatA [Oscillospiraceae bacterium]